MVVGLTGGAATGKSLVSEELKRLGAAVVDADLIAREVLSKGTPAYKDTIGSFGEGVKLADGSIDRKALGEIVFSSPEKLALLESITHPRIREIIRTRVEELKEKRKGSLIVVDAALLIEKGLYKEMDAVIVVYADRPTQIARLKKRNGLSEREAALRISAQVPVEEKLKYADYVIDNSGAPAETLKAVGELYSALVRGRC
ncbi:MAG: dephospho-CoA kinase [Thermodesulfobacteriota bacterium]